MKKIKFILFLPILFFILFIIQNLVWGHHYLISKSLEISLPLSVNIDYQNMRGGFQYDGEVLAQVHLTDRQAQKIISNIQKNPHWRKSPIEERLEIRITDSSDSFYRVIPKIENGYWFFKNDSPHSINIYDESELWTVNRFGQHFSVGVLDLNTNILYFYSYDA